jgi:hypothetical protein
LGRVFPAPALSLLKRQLRHAVSSSSTKRLCYDASELSRDKTIVSCTINFSRGRSSTDSLLPVPGLRAVENYMEMRHDIAGL